MADARRKGVVGMRRCRGGHAAVSGEAIVNNNSAGETLPGLEWRGWWSGAGQTTAVEATWRRRALLVSAACVSGFAIRSWMYAPLGDRWGSESSLRISNGLPEDLVGRPHQLMQIQGVDSHQWRVPVEGQRAQSLAIFQEERFKQLEVPKVEPSQHMMYEAEEHPRSPQQQQMGMLEEDRGTSSGGQSLSAMLTLLKESSEDLPVEAMRDYLNGLVEESVSRMPDQLSNIAFIKTHKTASTTLASILYRYGKRHDLTIAKFDQGGTYIDLDVAAKQVFRSGNRVDIMHYHHAWNGFYAGTWEEARSKYSEIMSDKSAVNYVTVLREPMAHYLSYYYYFINPINKMSIEEYLTKNPHKKLLYNPLAAEFGIENMLQMNDFIRNQLPTFKMVLLTERFDEGLALLQKMLDWEPIDMTYCKMLQTKKGEKRWDGKPLENVPKVSELPPEVLAHIKARTQLDVRLYQAGILLNRKYALDFGPGVEEHFEAFQGVQKVMHRYLEVNTSSDALKWYVGDVDIYDHGPPVLRF